MEIKVKVNTLGYFPIKFPVTRTSQHILRKFLFQVARRKAAFSRWPVQAVCCNFCTSWQR